VNLQTDSGAEAPEETTIYPRARERDLIRVARRHPATIALIQEISAQVNAAAEQRIELIKADLRGDPIFGHRLLRKIDVVTLGVFTTLNLLLVTVALTLGRLMPLWSAGLLVTGVTLAATAAVVVRQSGEHRVWIPGLRKLAGRRFARRLFANV
jgi:hypothetical protein